MTDLVGTTLGQYQIVELIGEGGMAGEAAVPTRLVRPNKLMNTAIAGFLGMFVEVLPFSSSIGSHRARNR